MVAQVKDGQEWTVRRSGGGFLSTVALWFFEVWSKMVAGGEEHGGCLKFVEVCCLFLDP